MSANKMYTDSPLPLLHTPQLLTGQTDPFTTIASHMALSHNAFIRGFNTIYQQAPRIEAKDKKDFVGYCLAWHALVEAHHRMEETDLFPNLDKAAGKQGLMGHVVGEHAAFHGGLERFREFVSCEGAGFEADELISIMDSFKDPMYEHMRSEPDDIVALAQYSTPEHPIDIVRIADEAGKKELSVGFVFNTLPAFLLNLETVEFEGGMWHGVFPPFRGVLKTVMMGWVPMWQGKRWQFASCGDDGRLKELAV